ncbi:Holliday junction branch migration DNA helicase RuvB [Chlamydiota bacterium]
MNEQFVENILSDEDLAIEVNLRPLCFRDFVGQEKIKERLHVFVTAAKERQEPLDHILFSGPPGLGKTTLAYILAHERGANIKSTSGPVIERPGDLAGILTNLEEGDILFIDEIHRLNHMVEEYLYSAMEDFVIDIMIDKGPNARSVRLNVPRFTLCGATTRSGLLTSPLRSRFGMTNRLNYYLPEELAQIILRSSRILDISIDKQGAFEIARRSRGTPRIANVLLRRVRDYAQVKADNLVTKDVADHALKLLDIDENGLDEMDKNLLELVIFKFDGGPVGLNTLSIALGEESDTLEEVYEPFLIQQGYLKRTPSGRKATKSAYELFGVTSTDKKSPQQEMF